MMTFYSAVGVYRIEEEDGRKVPYIQKLGKYHPISIPEFAIWSILLWEVMTYDELKAVYLRQFPEKSGDAPSFDELLDILVKRKLIVKGVGYTGLDALFGMLSNAFVVPFRIGMAKKFCTVLKLVISGKLGVDALWTWREKLDRAENHVMKLILQTPLSAPEILRCFERGVEDVSSPDKVISAIYVSEDSDQEHIANEERLNLQVQEVLGAIANLYLKRRVILELP